MNENTAKAITSAAPYICHQHFTSIQYSTSIERCLRQPMICITAMWSWLNSICFTSSAIDGLYCHPQAIIFRAPKPSKQQVCMQHHPTTSLHILSCLYVIYSVPAAVWARSTTAAKSVALSMLASLSTRCKWQGNFLTDGSSDRILFLLHLLYASYVQELIPDANLLR